MFKLIIFALGLAIGFGGGAYWSVKNPQEAERRVLEAELEASKRIKEKLDQIAAKRQQPGPAGVGFAKEFIDGKSVPDPDVTALRDEQDRKVKDLERRLSEVKK